MESTRIIIGDFAQLPPVGDVQLYSHIKQNQIGTVTGQNNIFGRLLWLSIDKVIILHEIVQQSATKDASFVQCINWL